MNKNHKILLGLICIRFIFSFMVLFYTNLNILIKVIAVLFVFDLLDSISPLYDLTIYKKGVTLTSDTLYQFTNFKNNYYTYYDKLMDLICIGMVILYLYIYNIIPINYISIILFFYFYRYIAFILYCLTQNRRVFIFFPNITDLLILWLCLVSHFKIQGINIWIGSIVIILIKIKQEYKLHSNI